MTTFPITSERRGKGSLWLSMAALLLFFTGSVGAADNNIGTANSLTSNPLAYPGARDYAVRPDILGSLQSRGYQPQVPTAPVNPGVSPRFEELLAPGYQTPVYQTPNYEAPQPTSPSGDLESISNKLSYRYTDSRMVGFLRTASMGKIASLYQEASQLIDQRHVSPPAYEARTRRALSSLSAALEHPAFLQAANANPNPTSVRNVQSQLNQLMQTQPARNSQQALSVMQYAAQMVSQSLGIRQEAAALEFVNGSFDSLDKYSAFVPAATAGGPSAGLEEHIVGVGVELKADESGAKIMGVIDGGPAAQARLQRGDVITGINGRSMQGLGLNEVADMITGPSGSSVRLRVRRDTYEGDVSLTRRSVYVSSVTGTQMIDPQNKVGYIRLKQFSESSADDLDKALWQLYREGMQSLIFDLRGNPGGLLTQAVAVSNKFIARGNIVATRGRNAEDNTLEKATYDRTWKVPMVVLVDENSASASEIFAAAIQDNQRGVIMGRHSYGKGTVQTHFPLRSVGGDLKLTTAKFYSPNGREMAGAGVTPDVPVNAAHAGFDFSLQEDADIVTAIQVTREGRPASLASQAGNVRTQPASTGYSG